MGHLQEWLNLAPPPPPLSEGQKWHLFLSYRSTERKWVLALYDILTSQLKYQVFMDQFVLVAGDGLATSLSKNLSGSQAGVLVWSDRNEDSAWCLNEFNAFESRRSKGTFRYVAVRLKNSTLPDWVESAIWVDASDERDGPSGPSLVRLLYGVQGLTLPPAAVKLMSDVDQTTQQASARIKALRAANDPTSIVAMTRSAHAAWRCRPKLHCEAAEALIALGARTHALAVLERIRANFPLTIRPQQLQALALARSGQWREAKVILGELYEMGELDAETVGMYARTWMDAYAATGEVMMLRRSRDLYAEAFAANAKDYYTGINAAAKSVFLGELDAGALHAAKVEAIVGATTVPNDYWRSATIAEVQLIRQNFEAAATLYEQAVMNSPATVDSHRATCKQARLLLVHLGATAEQAARVLAAFRREVRVQDSQDAVDRVRAEGRARVVTFTGFSGSGYEDPAEVRRIVLGELKQLDPANTLVCAGATPEGIGIVYSLAVDRGFRTAGIVSSQAKSDGVKFSNEVELVLVVEDTTWGGRQANGKLSPTSQAMVDACDEMVGIGGGAIARDELDEARRKGKTVRFHDADMNHAAAIEKAAKAGKAPPALFGGEAQALFTGQ